MANFVSVATLRSDTRSNLHNLHPRDDDTGQPHLRIVSPETPGPAAPQLRSSRLCSETHTIGLEPGARTVRSVVPDQFARERRLPSDLVRLCDVHRVAVHIAELEHQRRRRPVQEITDLQSEGGRADMCSPRSRFR